jgi:nitrite reductase/ring-hydroxylating ferredoxin subunit
MTTRRRIELAAGVESARDDGWIVIGRVEDVPVGGALVVALDPPIAVFNVGGELLATDDTCSHSKSSLGMDGIIEGDVVECAWHFARFCLRDGAALSPPARRPVRTHRVAIEDGHLLLSIAVEVS